MRKDIAKLPGCLLKMIKNRLWDRGSFMKAKLLFISSGVTYLISNLRIRLRGWCWELARLEWSRPTRRSWRKLAEGLIRDKHRDHRISWSCSCNPCEPKAAKYIEKDRERSQTAVHIWAGAQRWLTYALHHKHRKSCIRRTLPQTLSQYEHLTVTGRFPSSHWCGM